MSSRNSKSYWKTNIWAIFIGPITDGEGATNNAISSSVSFPTNLSSSAGAGASGLTGGWFSASPNQQQGTKEWHGKRESYVLFKMSCCSYNFTFASFQINCSSVDFIGGNSSSGTANGGWNVSGNGSNGPNPHNPFFNNGNGLRKV